MFDVLVYLYENYWRPDACPDHAQLTRKLSAVGFESDEIQEALSWLDGLAITAEAYSGQQSAGAGGRVSGYYSTVKRLHANSPGPTSARPRSGRWPRRPLATCRRWGA